MMGYNEVCFLVSQLFLQSFGWYRNEHVRLVLFYIEEDTYLAT